MEKSDKSDEPLKNDKHLANYSYDNADFLK